MAKKNKSNLELYDEFEAKIDCIICEFDFSSYSLNEVIDFFHFSIALKYSGEQISSEKYQLGPTGNYMSLCSYLLPIFNNCSRTYKNTSLDELMKMKLRELLPSLLRYAAYSEIAPYIRKNIYIPQINNKVLRLKYNVNYYEYELKDTVLTSLATGFSATDDLKNYEVYDHHIRRILDKKFNSEFVISEVSEYKEWYRAYRFDDLTVSEEVYLKLGLTKTEYIEFQSFWLGLTTYYIKKFESIIRYLKRIGDDNNPVLNKEMLRTASINLSKDVFYTTFTESLIGVSKDKFEQLMKLFSFNINNKLTLMDGYYPVFFEYEDSYLFSPFSVRVNMSPRNLLYLLNKNDPDIFNNEVSEHLEPQLICNCINLLSKIDSLEIRSNINWSSKGEFDIIAYDTIHNNVLHFQVKGTIPVQGARMTRNLESRMQEGINQISKFNQESQHKKESIISDIFEHKISNPNYINILLGWGGFGSYKIWKAIDEEKIVALNLAILNYFIKNMAVNYDFNKLYDDINNIIDLMVDSTNHKKVINKYKIGRYKIFSESFDYEETKLLKYKYVP